MSKENIFDNLFEDFKNGKEHSLKYENYEPQFAKYLRLNYYNVNLNNKVLSIIKSEYNKLKK